MSSQDYVAMHWTAHGSGVSACIVHKLIELSFQMQLTDDEEALKDEEEEAQRLQREAAEQLRPEDFEQDAEEDESEGSSSQDEEEGNTMGAKAKQVSHWQKANKLHVKGCMHIAVSVQVK